MRKTPRRTVPRKEFARRKPELEPLEDRFLLAANLHITNILLVDFENNPVSGVVNGEEFYVRAEWTTTDLTFANQYIVNIAVDGERRVVLSLAEVEADEVLRSCVDMAHRLSRYDPMKVNILWRFRL